MNRFQKDTSNLHLRRIAELPEYISDSPSFKNMRAERNLIRNEDKLKGWDVKTEYHAQLKTKEGIVDFWYTRNKWQFKGEMFYGRKPKWLTDLINRTLRESD
jgi:hypothetical protein